MPLSVQVHLFQAPASSLCAPLGGSSPPGVFSKYQVASRMHRLHFPLESLIGMLNVQWPRAVN